MTPNCGPELKLMDYGIYRVIQQRQHELRVIKTEEIKQQLVLRSGKAVIQHLSDK